MLDQTGSGIALLRLVGEHDLSTADEVGALLRRAAVQRVLHATGLEERLQVHSRREEAVSAARRAAA